MPSYRHDSIMLNAVIFDMDGVIIDSEPLHDRTSIQVAQELGYKDIDALQEDLDAFRGRGELDFWGYMKNIHKLDPSLQELMEMKQKHFFYLVASEPDVQPIEGVQELAESLRKLYPLALASSSAHAVIRAVLQRLNMAELFNVAVSGDDVEHGKPAPDIFLFTAKKLYVEPEHCVVIEDSESGVAAAKAAGMKCIGFKGLDNNTQDLAYADMIITGYEELSADILKALF